MSRFNVAAFKQLKKDNRYTNFDIRDMLQVRGISVSIDTIKSWTRSVNPPCPENDTIKALADIFGVGVSSLDNYVKNGIDGEGDNVDTITIPMLYAGAGAEAVIDHGLMEKIRIEKRLIGSDVIGNFSENTIAFKVIGDSMEPRFNEGDVLFIDMVGDRSPVFADGIWLVRLGDTVQIKQVQFLGNGEANIISFNKEYPITSTVEYGSWEILGKPFMAWRVERFGSLEVEA